MARTPWEHYASQKNNIKNSILNTYNDWNLWNPSTTLTKIIVNSKKILFVLNCSYYIIINHVVPTQNCFIFTLLLQVLQRISLYNIINGISLNESVKHMRYCKFKNIKSLSCLENVYFTVKKILNIIDIKMRMSSLKVAFFIYYIFKHLMKHLSRLNSIDCVFFIAVFGLLRIRFQNFHLNVLFHRI